MSFSFYLIKSGYIERKQVDFYYFLRCSLTVLLSNTKSRSLTVTHLFVWNTRTNSVTHTLQRFDCLHQRFICLSVWKLYSAIFDYKVKFLNKKLLYKFLAICDYIHELYNTMFQNVKRVFHQNKAHTKIS